MLKTEVLFKKIRFTVIILAVYRLFSYMPLPFVDVAKLSQFISYASTGILGMLNTFSGGSMARVSVLGLGIMPYISSSIIMQLLSVSIPALQDLKEQGEAGRVKINFYIKVLTILIGMLQGYMLASGFVSMGLYDGTLSLESFKFLCAATMVLSTLILIWLADLCSAYGIGNGTSLIIFAGIVAEMPKDIGRIYGLARDGSLSSSSLLLILFVFIATVTFVVFSERSNRLLLIQYPRQQQMPSFARGNMKKENFLPLKVNNAGVIPPIFSSAVLALPVSIISLLSLEQTAVGFFLKNNLVHGTMFFFLCFSALTIFFSFFYNSAIFNVEDIAKNLKKSGVFVPGCRPGESTAKLLTIIMSKLSLIGAGYLILLSIIPELLTPKIGYSIFLGGTSVLIIVNVVVDTIISVQTAFLSNKYNQVARRYDK